jgi:hypothetical protein
MWAKARTYGPKDRLVNARRVRVENGAVGALGLRNEAIFRLVPAGGSTGLGTSRDRVLAGVRLDPAKASTAKSKKVAYRVLRYRVISGRDIVAVSAQGRVTARLKPGTAKIRVFAPNGRSAVSTVRVVDYNAGDAFGPSQRPTDAELAWVVANQGRDLRAVARYFVGHAPASRLEFSENTAAELVKEGAGDTSSIDPTILRFLDDSHYDMWISVDATALVIHLEHTTYDAGGVAIVTAKTLIYTFDGTEPVVAGTHKPSAFAPGWWSSVQTYP